MFVIVDKQELEFEGPIPCIHLVKRALDKCRHTKTQGIIIWT